MQDCSRFVIARLRSRDSPSSSSRMVLRLAKFALISRILMASSSFGGLPPAASMVLLSMNGPHSDTPRDSPNTDPSASDTALER